MKRALPGLREVRRLCGPFGPRVRGAGLAGLLIGMSTASASLAQTSKDYGLQPVAVAEGVFVLPGRSESFSRENGGNIVNTGFIVGTDGIIVIDTGPSRAYGEQQRAAIARISSAPVVRAYITHAHPDHFLGNQSYEPTVPMALAATNESIRENGDALADNLYRLVGGWMSGTRAVAAADTSAGPVRVAGRPLRVIAAAGHTDSDLMVYDERSKTLFTGDLVFFDRAPTTPNADIPRWLAALDEIDRIDFVTLVPGHGPVTHGHAAVAQTREYLRWLQATLQDAAARGLDMPEVMRMTLPARFAHMAVVETEFTRSVTHLYPAIELPTLKPAAGTH